MNRLVAFVSVCSACVLLCMQASPAFGMKAGLPAEGFPDRWEQFSMPAGPDSQDLSLGMACLPGIRDLLLPAGVREVYRADEDGRGIPLLFRTGRDIFTGSSRKADRLIYSIDPDTMCISVLINRHGAPVKEEWAVIEGSFPGSRSEQARGSSHGSRSGFMAVAGLSLIGLSGLSRNRVARGGVRVYGARDLPQPWKTRAWKDYPAEKGPAYQTKAA